MPAIRLTSCLLVAGGLVSLACSPSGEGVSGGPGSGGSGTGAAPVGGGSGDSGASGQGGNGGSPGGSGGMGAVGGGVDLPPGTDPVSLLPARIRRLTNDEYAAAVQALLGMPLPPDVILPPETRQDGFSRNESQRVDPVWAKQIAAAAEVLAEAAKPRVSELAPCADSPAGEACAAAFIEGFGRKAYRRRLTAEEGEGLLAVYRIGAEGATYADGIALVIRTLLQATGFLYETEIGDGTVLDPIVLAPHELASSLAFLLTGRPPSQELLDVADAGGLATPEGREAVARDLFGFPNPAVLTGADPSHARGAVLDVVKEWLSIDRIAETGKDSNVYTDFEALRPAMIAETDDFISHVIARSTGTVGELLGADYTVASAELATQYYDVAPAADPLVGTVSLAGTTRRGILNHASFLSVFAHATESAPILRGVAVLERVLCYDPGSPLALNVVIVPPQPDPNLTTRERFAVHSMDPECAGCHTSIDGVGFTFENFDGMGRFRNGMENNRPVDTSGMIEIGADVDGTYADSGALAEALASSPYVRECFSKHLFHAMVARSGDEIAASKASFVTAWKADSAAEAGNMVQSVLAYIRSPLFAYRKAQ